MSWRNLGCIKSQPCTDLSVYSAEVSRPSTCGEVRGRKRIFQVKHLVGEHLFSKKLGTNSTPRPQPFHEGGVANSFPWSSGQAFALSLMRLTSGRINPTCASCPFIGYLQEVRWRPAGPTHALHNCNSCSGKLVPGFEAAGSSETPGGGWGGRTGRLAL